MKALKGYIITILVDDDGDTAEAEEILAGRVLGDAEDVINDALPEGFKAKISEAQLLR